MHNKSSSAPSRPRFSFQLLLPPRRRPPPPNRWPAPPLIPRSALVRQPRKDPGACFARRQVHLVHRAARWRAQRVGGRARQADAAKPITNDQQARHPPALLGVRQQPRAVSCRTKAATRTGTCMPSMSSAAPNKDITPYKGVRAPRSWTSRGRSRASWPSVSTTASPNGTTSGKSTSPPASARSIEKNKQEIRRLSGRLRSEAETRTKDNRRRHGDLPPSRRQMGEPAQVSARKIR